MAGNKGNILYMPFFENVAASNACVSRVSGYWQHSLHLFYMGYGIKEYKGYNTLNRTPVRACVRKFCCFVENVALVPSVKNGRIRMRESALEKRLVREIRAVSVNAMCLKLVSPGNAGVPDRLILLPGGWTVLVEMKRPGQKERPLQEFVQARIRDLGFDVFSTVDSVEAIHVVADRCRELIAYGQRP